MYTNHSDYLESAVILCGGKTKIMFILFLSSDNALGNWIFSWLHTLGIAFMTSKNSFFLMDEEILNSHYLELGPPEITCSVSINPPKISFAGPFSSFQKIK